MGSPPSIRAYGQPALLALLAALALFACTEPNEHPPVLPDDSPSGGANAGGSSGAGGARASGGRRGSGGARASGGRSTSTGGAEHDAGLDHDAGDATDATPQSDASNVPDATQGAPSREGTLETTNSAGRKGEYFLPSDFDLAPRPILLAYHGSGGQGLDMVAAFRALAIARGLIVVAPDSRRLDAWEVGTLPGEITPDYQHAMDCLAEVRRLPGVTVDEARTLVAGHSAGGSSAAYLATREPIWKAFAVLHGGVFEGSIGSNVVPAWLSTGEADDIRPAAGVQQAADYVTGLGFPDVTFRLYPGGHDLSTPELTDLVAWWLGS